jgi:hypothetical protein
MKWSIYAVCLFLLSACANPNLTTPSGASGLTVNDHQSVVIVGFSLVNPKGLGVQERGEWMAIDPHTGLRVGKRLLLMWAACSVGSAPMFSMGSFSDACDGDAQYLAFEAEPGTYGLAWVIDNATLQSVSAKFYPTSDFSRYTLTTSHRAGSHNTTVELSDVARIRRDTPVFTVKPGEAVYIGEIVADFTKGTDLQWKQRVNDTRAKDLLTASGLSDRMVVRPWTTAAGTLEGKAAGIAIP